MVVEMEKVIAITSCTKMKQDYRCSVREMFSRSPLFLARQTYLDKVYDEWYLWEEDDGLLSPDTIIDPQEDLYITTRNQHTSNTDTQVLSKERINRGLEILKQQYPDTSNIMVHVHASEAFYDQLCKVFQNIVHIRPQKTFPNTSWKYHDAIVMYNEGKSRDECNTFIDRREDKQIVEQPKWFYHNEHGSFYGKSSDLYRDYPDQVPRHLAASLWALSVGNINMTNGWVTNRDYLPHIKKNNNRYSLNKRAPGYKPVDRSHQRRGLREALLKLK